MAAEAAEAEAECALMGSGGNDPCWQGRAGAVVIYAMWALNVLRHRGLLEPCVKTREGSNSWLRPEWWGSDLHTTHRELLMDRSDTYRQRFTKAAGLLPPGAVLQWQYVYTDHPDLVDLDTGDVYEWVVEPAGGGPAGYAHVDDYDFAWPRAALTVGGARIAEVSLVDPDKLLRLRGRDRALSTPQSFS